MAHAIGTIREIHTTNFAVIIDALPEFDLDLSFDDTGEVAEKLDNGDYISFVARVRVMRNGAELATSYLGGCIYESLSAFKDYRDMVAEACQEARKHLCDLRAVKVRGCA